MTTIFLISGSTWTVPSDWNASGATIECIGPGGNGGKDPNNGGGQGGGYGKVTSPSNINVGDTLSIQIGAGGSTNPTWLKNNASTIIVQGDYGANASAGGSRTQTNIGDVTYNGGVGGTPQGFSGGGGGGGAAGPNGNGARGGNAVHYAGNSSSGGGGAASGGSQGADALNTSPAASGGDASNGSGHGAGGTSASQSGTAGTPQSGYGGPGGGAAYYTTAVAHNAGPGAIGQEWDSTHGAGGGGGGAGGNSGNGADGGLYGGGGGGCGNSNGIAGSGAQGVIVITYTPGGAATVLRSFSCIIG